MSIHSVNSLRFFHKLKTQWKVCKSLAVAPVFRVEFHTFHKVFHNLISTGSEPCIHFVIFKSELWQNFEAERHLFCLFIQHHFDECGSVLKIRPSSSFLSFGRSLHIIWKFVAFYRIYALLAVTPCTLPETESPHCYRKSTGLDWFWPLFGVY